MQLCVMLLYLPLVAHSSFVTSLHSKYVVNLDFEGGIDDPTTDEGEETEPLSGESKIMAFAGGKRKFKCHLPTGKNQTTTKSKEPDAVKAQQHFLSAKLASFRGSCWKMQKDYWTYEVCFGSKISQFRPGSDMRFSLGEHMSKSDELLENGGVKEMYLGGTDNRTAELIYACGSSEQNKRTFKIEENTPLVYTITMSGPQFCVWREKGGSRAHDANGRELMVAALLEELRSSCINVTQGWWTYEYCFPRGLQQYHLSGTKRDPEYTLGTLNGTGASTEVDQVNMSIVRLRPSINPRERRAAPSGHRTLRQRLPGGTVCDETRRPRSTTMHFQCPTNWQSRPETRIVSINEASLCEYEMMVHTTLLCGHYKFIPSLPKGKETIQCVAQPGEA